MIRVNLAGTPKKKAVAAAKSSGGPVSALPVVHLLLLAGTAAGGYLWYSGLAGESAALAEQFRMKDEEKKKLEAVIKQDQIFESRKSQVEARIRVIEGLRKNQVSPVVMLDMLGDAIDRTQYVWLNTLNQNNTTLTMSGNGNSVDALAAFVGNLESTNYFRNINLQRFEDSRGNFTFSMTCEFSPPAAPPAPSTQKGAN